jgi:hypothetical protein
VLRQPNGLALVSDALETSLTSPMIAVIDEGMFGHVRGVFRRADGWQQGDSQHKDEAGDLETQNLRARASS